VVDYNTLQHFGIDFVDLGLVVTAEALVYAYMVVVDLVRDNAPVNSKFNAANW
jgi:hypothetical protein